MKQRLGRKLAAKPVAKQENQRWLQYSKIKKTYPYFFFQPAITKIKIRVIKRRKIAHYGVFWSRFFDSFRVRAVQKYYKGEKKGKAGVLYKNAFFFTNKLKNNILNHQKQRLNVLDKVFYYYKFQLVFTFFTYKVLSYFEMFLSAFLVNNKLVKYGFQLDMLSFYNIIYVNGSVCSNLKLLVSLYDTVLVATPLSFYLIYQQYQQNFFTTKLMSYFRLYWRRFTTFRLNKMWLLQNVVRNKVPECIIFEYPNVLLYVAPMRRITSLFFNTTTRDQIGHMQPRTRSFGFNYQQALLKTKLFEYAAFYK